MKTSFCFGCQWKGCWADDVIVAGEVPRTPARSTIHKCVLWKVVIRFGFILICFFSLWQKMDMQTGQVQRSCGTEEMCTNSKCFSKFSKVPELCHRLSAVNYISVHLRRLYHLSCVCFIDFPLTVHLQRVCDCFLSMNSLLLTYILILQYACMFI